MLTEYIIRTMYPEASLVVIGAVVLAHPKYAVFSRPQHKQNSYNLVATGETFMSERDAWTNTCVYLGVRNKNISDLVNMLAHILDVNDMKLDTLEEPCPTT